MFAFLRPLSPSWSHWLSRLTDCSSRNKPVALWLLIWIKPHQSVPRVVGSQPEGGWPKVTLKLTGSTYKQWPKCLEGTQLCSTSQSRNTINHQGTSELAFTLLLEVPAHPSPAGNIVRWDRKCRFVYSSASVSNSDTSGSPPVLTELPKARGKPESGGPPQRLCSKVKSVGKGSQPRETCDSRQVSQI